MDTQDEAIEGLAKHIEEVITFFTTASAQQKRELVKILGKMKLVDQLSECAEKVKRLDDALFFDSDEDTKRPSCTMLNILDAGNWDGSDDEKNLLAVQAMFPTDLPKIDTLNKQKLAIQLEIIAERSFANPKCILLVIALLDAIPSGSAKQRLVNLQEKLQSQTHTNEYDACIAAVNIAVEKFYSKQQHTEVS